MILIIASGYYPVVQMSQNVDHSHFIQGFLQVKEPQEPEWKKIWFVLEHHQIAAFLDQKKKVKLHRILFASYLYHLRNYNIFMMNKYAVILSSVSHDS